MKLLITLLSGLFLLGCSLPEIVAPSIESRDEKFNVANVKSEEVTPKSGPVIETNLADPVYKIVCIDIQGKNGKPVMDTTGKIKQNCVKVRIREKFKGTAIENANKK